MSDIPPPFDAAWFRFFLGFIIGAALGSFGTMLAYRLPRHMSIVQPGSHCPTCGTRLQSRDLIPILSWILMHGQCRYCQTKINTRYIGIECATSVACGFVSAVIGITPILLLAYLLILLAVVAVSIKIDKHIS